MKTLSEETVNDLIRVVNCGLVKGMGVQEPGKMCVEAAVCFAFGLPHGDNPPCVGSAVRSYKIRLNDAYWSSNEARAKGMLGVAIAQIGSDTLDQREFANRIIIKTANTLIADIAKKYLPGIDQELRTATDLDVIQPLCRQLRKAAYAANAAYAADAADAAAYAANAAYAADAAAYAAYAADAADAAAYAAAYAADAERDKVLNQAAQNCLEVLKEMKSPGCEYLYLIEK